MVWFKVDDKLHSNTKIRKLLADDPAALALWTVAGSWSSDELNDGFVPDDQLRWLLPARADELAQKLVSARLWRRVRGGYQFHQWHADGDGTKRNPTRAEVEAERQRKAEAGRLGGLASAKARSNGQAPGSARAGPRASGVLQPPTRPDPSPSYEGERARADGGLAPPGAEPPTRCTEHDGQANPPPCGGCAEARKGHERWETAKANWDRHAPKCPKHRGQKAHNCRVCRSEALAGTA